MPYTAKITEIKDHIAAKNVVVGISSTKKENIETKFADIQGLVNAIGKSVRGRNGAKLKFHSCEDCCVVKFDERGTRREKSITIDGTMDATDAYNAVVEFIKAEGEYVK